MNYTTGVRCPQCVSLVSVDADGRIGPLGRRSSADARSSRCYARRGAPIRLDAGLTVGTRMDRSSIRCGTRGRRAPLVRTLLSSLVRRALGHPAPATTLRHGPDLAHQCPRPLRLVTVQLSPSSSRLVWLDGHPASAAKWQPTALASAPDSRRNSERFEGEDCRPAAGLVLLAIVS